MGSFSASFCPQNKDFWYLCYGSEVDYPICVWIKSILFCFGFVLFLDFPVNRIGGHRPSNLHIYIFLLLDLSCGLWTFMILVFKLKFIICSLLDFTKWFSLLGKTHQTWYTFPEDLFGLVIKIFGSVLYLLEENIVLDTKSRCHIPVRKASLRH